MLKRKLSLLLLLFLALPVAKVKAQIVPDETLGEESSVVTPVDELNDNIEGGAARGDNLFHSFREFNIGEGRGVDFVNPAGIENILTRVTGGNVSNILGRLGVLGEANLFLINPNGILFGEGASLDIGGSFYGSTADSILFPNGVEFSTTNPQESLLTINRPIGLVLGNNPGDIVNRSFVLNSTGTDFVGLEVTPGETLTLVGGNINFEGGGITAPGGRVNLGGLTEAGTVGLNNDGSLSFSDNVARADIFFTNGAFVDVLAGGGGFINIDAKNLALMGRSILQAGIGEGMGNLEAVGGDVVINATSNVVNQGSAIFNQVLGVGNSGNIEITTTDLSLIEGGILIAGTLGEGDAGKIIVNASGTILLDGEDGSRIFSNIGTLVGETGVGNSGNIEITTTDLSLRGGFVNADTFGEGDAGKITINASGTILVDGEDNESFASSIATQVVGTGNSGGIEIVTADLSIIRGGFVTAGTFGEGDAGKITINASGTILIDGKTPFERPSGITNQVSSIGIGNSGGIEIITTDLSIINGGGINSSTFGQGDAGKITIDALDTILIDGKSQFEFLSSINSQVTGGIGNSGGIEITTTNLYLKQEGRVSAGTLGEGDAGNIVITAKTIEATSGGQIQSNTDTNFDAGDIILKISDNLFLSGSGTALSAFTQGAGTAGNINIETPQITIEEEASVFAPTVASGDGGTITITAPQAVLLKDGSQLTVETNGAGKPGNISIATPNLTIGRDAQISATATETSTNTEGGGSITINASNLDLTGQLGIFAETEGEAPAGTLTIQSYLDRGELNIEFTDTALISTLTEASGRGGNINITAPETINISGEGKITVETSGSGNAGSINIETENSNISDRTQISASTEGTGEAGDITINAANLSLTEGVELFTNTSSSTQAGDIQLNITDSINLSNSSIEAGTTENSTGDGGSIIITPVTTTTIQDGAEIAVNSLGSGRGGDITLQADSLTLDGGSINATTTSNQGGNINLILSDSLILRDDSRITATAGTAQAGGDGGNITIDSNFIIAFPTANNYEITAEAFTGDGGNITIDTNSILGRDNVRINASSNFGIDGTIAINDPDVDPTSGIIELPTVPIDAEAILAQDLCRFEDDKIAKGSSFIITGRGGLTPTSEDALGNVDNVVGWANREDIEVSQNGVVGVRQRSQAETVTTNYPVVQQSQGWVKTSDGNVWLVANAPETIPQNAKLVHPDCGTSP